MRQKLCRKCGDYIPLRITVDGKLKSLQNRKFCLQCSPYKGHNTKTDDPARISLKKSNYVNWSEEDKRIHTVRVYRRGIERKAKLVEMLGGKCKECGYNKCMRCLTFHHLDRSTKVFGLAINELWSRSWNTILEEAKKCELLCIRCHLEKEDDLSPVNENSYRSIIDRIYPIDK